MFWPLACTLTRPSLTPNSHAPQTPPHSVRPLGRQGTLPLPLARPLLPRHARTRGRVRLNGGPCSIRNDGFFAPRGLNGRQGDDRRSNGTMDAGGVSVEAPLHIIGESNRHPTARECRNISAGTIRTGKMGRMHCTRAVATCALACMIRTVARLRRLRRIKGECAPDAARVPDQGRRRDAARITVGPGGDGRGV